MAIRFIMSGHVDHGKSTILGRLLYDLGIITRMKGTYASLLDILDDERDRSITVEASSMGFTYRDQEYMMIDTPGHKQYIRELISMVTPDSVGCIVISAVDREFRAGFLGRGQTREDILILRAAGIKSLIVLVNKMDRVSYQEEVFMNIKDTMSKYIDGLRYQKVSYLPVCAIEGNNLTNKDTAHMPWYTGPSFMDLLTTHVPDTPASTAAVVTTDRILCDIRMVQVPIVITAGYSFIGHTRGKEVPMTIDRMKPRYISKPSECQAIVNTSSSIDISIGDIILMRSSETTLGIMIIRKT